jgi:ATP-dependent exoDNAse (exonuclease V) beta subunit
VLDRPLDMISQDEPSVMPGLHEPQRGSHDVLWWDPAGLGLNAPENFGLRHVDILEAQGSAAASIKHYDAWKDTRAGELQKGRVKNFDIWTATGMVDPPPGPLVAVLIESAGQADRRPRGVRFGSLLHAILRDTDLDAGRDRIEPLAEMHAKLLDATDAETASAVDAVLAALGHPLLARARAAQRRHREMPLMLPLGDGKILEAVIDLAFLENGEWTIVDFKSDAELSSSQGRYQRQMQWYAYALSKLTGLPAHPILLRA